MEAFLVGIIGIGGLYTIASQNSAEDSVEGFNLQEDKNYPVEENDINSVNKYDGETQAVDKYYNQEYFEQQSREYPHENNIKLMSDQYVNPSEFKHNNMVPYFGSKVKGTDTDKYTSTILDNLNGSGSQMVTKQESAPLFKPSDNVHWANGTPNTSDFIQSRQNSSLLLNNVTPFQKQSVAPGLNLGYTTEGSNGFNSGMEARNTWMPKTVDELRTVSNPKLSYNLEGHQGPAQSNVKNLGKQGKIEKYRPDTDFENGPERYFTTVGEQKAQTARGIYNDKENNRATTSVSYQGIADSSVNTSYAPVNYESLAKNEHLYGEMFGGAGSLAQPASKNDYGNNSFKVRPNNRVTTNQPNEFGGVSGVVNAVTAPFMDALRHTRKEDIIGNNRTLGNVQQPMTGEYVNPVDVPKTTIKEMTVGKGNQLYIQGPTSGGYKVSKQQTYTNQRDTTNQNILNGGSANYGNKQEDLYFKNQRNNVNKVQRDYTPSGTHATFNNNVNMQIDSERGTLETNRVSQPMMASSGPNLGTHGKISVPQQYNNDINDERINPDLLDAFKQNPYTHTLHSF